MEFSHPNHSVECSVSCCKNHCVDCDCCSLSRVRIGTHESNPEVCECTDCECFEKKQ